MEYKQLFRRMNLDADVRSLQPGEYRKLFNGIPISPKSSSYTNAIHDVLASLFGNAVVSYSLPSGTNKCIGFLEDKINNRAFYFVYNNTAASNSIYRYQGGAITLVFRSALLDFAATDIIDSDIVGDVIFFTNRRTDTYKIDITKAIAGGVYTPLIGEILLIKPAPKLSPVGIVNYDYTVNTNGIAGNYFTFFYRYVYENNDYSVFSPASRTLNGWQDAAIVVSYVTSGNWSLSGLTAVDGITLIAGDKILVVDQTTESENGVYTAAAGAWSRASLTAGDVPANTFVYVSSGVARLNTTWQFIDTGNVTIGTDDMFWRQIDGPNYIRVFAGEVAPATVVKVEYAVRVNGTNELFVYREETPSFSVSHLFYNDTYLYSVPDSEAFKWNDSVPIASNSLKVFKNRLFLLNNTEGYEHASSQSVVLTLDSIATTFATVTDTRAYSCRKPGASYTVGLMFFDAGRRHSSIQCEERIDIPDRNDFAYNISVNTASITPPSWATHFSIGVTKCSYTSFFLKDTSVDIYHFNKLNDGTYTYSKSSTSAEGTFIDISCLTRNKRGYTFTQGDRIKLYVPVVAGQPSTIIDVAIQGQIGNFLQVRTITEVALTAAASNYVFEIYTPKVKSFEPFFEVGVCQPVANIVSSSPFLLNGDVVTTRRPVYTDSSGYSGTDPFANAYAAASVTTLESMNVYDDKFETWIDSGGRSLVKSDSKQLLKTGFVKFSNPFTQGSTVFGLNSFDALDDYALPVENGVGIQLADTGDVLVAIHETETTSVYVGEGFVNTTNGDNLLSKTDSVIGDDRRYQGGYGSTHPASVVVRNGRVYYLDARRGVVVRRSQDGLTPISNYGVSHEISTLCNTHNSLATSRIVGGWDPQYECYTLSFIDTAGPTGYTYYFHEDSNSWVCLTDIRPDFFGVLGQKQIAFLAGALWLQSIESNYNNWFGVQYNRRLEFEISPMQSLVHLWDALEVDVASIYSTAGTNEDVVLLYHENGGTLQTKINYLDFQLKEGVYRSSFFRYLNDINFQNVTESKYKSPHQVRGQSAFMVITYNGTDKNVMKSITVFYTPSMNSSP